MTFPGGLISVTINPDSEIVERGETGRGFSDVSRTIERGCEHYISRSAPELKHAVPLIDILHTVAKLGKCPSAGADVEYSHRLLLLPSKVTVDVLNRIQQSREAQITSHLLLKDYPTRTYRIPELFQYKTVYFGAREL
ncbi:hypothetical protein R1flu_028696 [Riccia fluitans]|uniref:Uncharacterized protein n=1 Tax=Riccia fluitans TaxID=41844 RepID=A0ABD1XRH1_9MARC